MKRNKSAVVLCALALCVFAASCAGTEDPKAAFRAEPCEMLSVERCGFDAALAEELLGHHGVTVYVGTGETGYSFTDVQAPLAATGEEDGVFLLTAYAPGLDATAEPRRRADAWIPAGAVAEELAALIPDTFPETTASIRETCSAEPGIQLDRRLPDGSVRSYVVTTDGYILTAADPAEYDPDGLSFLAYADLPAGFACASIPKESFARIAAWEAACSGDKLAEECRFAAHTTPEADAAGYRLCISASGRHLNLSLLQAKEFLTEHLGETGNTVHFAGFALDPAERPTAESLVKITEYSAQGELEQTCYLAPSGKLLRLRSTLGQVAQTGYFAVSATMVTSSEETFDYDAVQKLLAEVGSPT